MSSSELPTVLSICPVKGDNQMFYVRLKTSHYSFSIKRSCVTRSCSSFYQLRSILKVQITEYYFISLINLIPELSPSPNDTHPAHVTLPLDPQQSHHLLAPGHLPYWGAVREATSIQQGCSSLPPDAAVNREDHRKSRWHQR